MENKKSLKLNDNLNQISLGISINRYQFS